MNGTVKQTEWFLAKIKTDQALTEFTL